VTQTRLKEYFHAANSELKFELNLRPNFRILTENGTIINECNDDGESRAGEWVLEPLVVRFDNRPKSFEFDFCLVE
jgi:hypothetical protein